MFNLADNWFYWLMLAGAVIVPLLLLVLYSRRTLRGVHLQLYVMGVAIGLLWEVPLHFLGPRYQADSIYIMHMEWPLLPITQPVTAAIWDGMFFLLCLLAVRLILPQPHFTRLRWSEFVTVAVCGGISALLVEVLATSVAWSYGPRVWNPALFYIDAHPVTAMPVLIWLAVSGLFYVITVRVLGRST